MRPAAPGRGGGSADGPRGGPAPPGNTKDIIVIYEEDAEEWALYLREIFLRVVKREAILLYCLENFSLRHLELLNLTSYECKLLILSNSLLKDLTPKKCQFLEKVLHSPESVVTMLCGVKSSDQLYKLLNISGSRWEISTEQEPEDYISVIQSIMFRGSEDYLEVDIPMNLRVKHSGEMNDRRETEEFPEAPRSTLPLAVLLPAEIPCENPGEIFIILRDEVTVDTVEVEFTSNNKQVRTQPAPWNRNVWCMKALEFPAGLVNVDVYCDGIIKATAKVKYYAPAKVVGCPLGVVDPGESLCQNDIEELDGVLTATFKHEIPYYEFQSLQTEISSQKECTHFRELPTLLHCAAKFGLKNLATHLLQCSGATWASKIKNMEGSDPADIAERHGHEELKKIFEDFSEEQNKEKRKGDAKEMIQEIGRNYEQENDYEQDIISFSTYIPSAAGSPALRQDGGQTGGPGARGPAGRGQEDGSEEAASGSSEDQYDDLYVSIPRVDPASNSQEPLAGSRPPPPPPRPVPAAFQLEKPHLALQGTMVEGHMENSQTWCDRGIRQETGDESKGDEEKKDEKEQEEEEDPYTFAEIDDSDYDMILASLSIKKNTGSRSFIINRPPAPTPRPTNMPPKEKTTPYIAQVFQKKTPRRQSEDDKFHGVPKKQDRARMESLTAGQEELILLQEKVKNGKMSVDEALEKFKHWQMGKSGLEMIQQEKLRQLRDCIIGKRPEEENVYDKLTIVHHPGGKEIAHNESMLYNMPFSNKLPARLQAEKEFGFCCRKDH